MRLVGALVVVVGCGSSSAAPPEIVGGDPVTSRAVTRAEIASALRVAELAPDGVALIAADGPSLSIGARLQVAVLESFDGDRTTHPVVTVTIDERIDRFLDAEETQTFLVCGDSRGGDPPSLYRAHVTGGSTEGVAPFAAAIAWPTELDLTYEVATGAPAPTEPAEPRVRNEAEPVQLDDDAGLERVSFTIELEDANPDCPFPYRTWEIAFDDDGETRLGTSTPEAGCFAQIPLAHDMACCSEPACTAGDRRASCRWPPSFAPRFEPDLAPARFTDRPFLGNLRGPITGVVRRGHEAVWIRHRVSFEGEAFVIDYADGEAIVAAADAYLYHCAY